MKPLFAFVASWTALVTGAGALEAQALEGVFGTFPSEDRGLSLPAAGEFLTQPPNRPPLACLYSDPDVVQVLAENFVVTGAPIQIDEIVLRGYYSITNKAAIDSFNVRFLTDSSGLPGAPVAPQETSVPLTRIRTDFKWAILNEYEFTLSLINPVTLSAGTYWVEIYDITSESNSSFCWETGVLDPVNGVAGLASSNESPGVHWKPGTFDLALELNGVQIPVELEHFEIE